MMSKRMERFLKELSVPEAREILEWMEEGSLDAADAMMRVLENSIAIKEPKRLNLHMACGCSRKTAANYYTNPDTVKDWNGIKVKCYNHPDWVDNKVVRVTW